MKIKLISFLLLLSSATLAGCSDWTDQESINEGKTDFNDTTKDDAYYAALREWKATPGLPNSFIWFDSWNGVSPTGENSLRGLPDSVTIASNWGGHPKFNLTPERKADMEYVQKVKGTKVVVTTFSENLGDDMPWVSLYNIGNTTDENIARPAIRHYAEAIYDAVVASGYDGFDWDFEPSQGSNKYLWQNRTQSRIFVEELSYWFGPGATDPTRDRGDRKPAKPGLLLVIDGELTSSYIVDWPLHLVNYYVFQSYWANSPTSLANSVDGLCTRMSKLIDEGLITKEEIISRCIFTANFESYASTGGGILNMANFVYNKNGIDHQGGGFGIYRSGFDYNQGKGDYNGSPEYYWLRQSITAMYRLYNQRQQEAEAEPEETPEP